jgi:hypothetical protein
MAEMGQKATYAVRHRASALPLKADIRRRFLDVSQGPKSDMGNSKKMPLENTPAISITLAA